MVKPDPISNSTFLEKIKKEFTFLVSDFGYQLQTAIQVYNYRAANFFVYRNDESKLQIEICADESWFHSEIRRLIDGKPADYNDRKNCVSFEDIAIWESENNYDHFDYFVGGNKGLDGVINSTANLFKRNKNLFTTGGWLDTDKIQQLKDKDFERKFGKLPDTNKSDFFREMKSKVWDLLTDSNCQFLFDSDNVSPFSENSLTNKFILEVNDSKIELRQKDWREYYFVYELFKNDKKVFEIDLSKLEIDQAVELTIAEIKKILESK